MKVEDAKDGDVSPIHHLSDDSKPSSSRKKPEQPTSEPKPNLSRVTPAQLAYISFPSDARYQPVRTVTSAVPPSTKGAGKKVQSQILGSEKYGGGGGILILLDTRPDEEAEFLELEPPAVVPPPAEVTPTADAGASAQGAVQQGPHIALGGDDAPPPEPFEVRRFFCVFWKTEN